MTTAQVVEMSVTVNNNSPIQDYVHPDDQSQPIFEMTPRFKPFTVFYYTSFGRKRRQTHRHKESELILLLEIIHCARNLQINQLSASRYLTNVVI